MGSVLLITFRFVCVVLLYIFTFCVPCSDVRYDFRIKRCSVRFYLQLFVGGLMSYLRDLCLLIYIQWCPAYIVLCFCIVFLPSCVVCFPGLSSFYCLRWCKAIKKSKPLTCGERENVRTRYPLLFTVMLSIL